MIIERPIDTGVVYERLRQDLLTLVRSLDEHQRSSFVPASPEWTVLDVVAHVVGIAADLNAGELGRPDPEAWTRAQVTGRRGCTIDDLAAEWAAEAPTFEEGLRLFGYEVGSHFIGDLLQHVADVHHAVGMARIADDQTLVVALDFYLDSLHETLVEAEVGSVHLVIDGETWALGTGPVVASVTTNRFEAFRALGGRRTTAQVRALAWMGDVDRIIDLISRYGVPARDLIEP